MDFDDTAAEAAFRAEARAWLEQHARLRTGENDAADHHARADASPQADAEHARRCRTWQQTLHEHGWAGITWPRGHGGRGGTPRQAAIFAEEQARFDVSAGVFAVAIAMVGPTLIAHGTPDQQSHLPAILRGEEIWCQLFSEPGAGSDLASLRTRAVLDGDEWVVDGQKVWTSGAHNSDWAILLARTDPDVPKHRGLSYFLVDMRTAGIEVRPLRQINGVAHFNEVFLTGVRVPTANLVGDVGDGWRVALTTLAHERTMIGSGGGTRFSQLVRLARQTGRTDDPGARQGLARAYIRYEVLRYLGLRVQTALSQGRTPGPESSVLKLAYSRHVSELGDLAMALLSADGMVAERDGNIAAFWQQQFLNQWAIKIGGGTDQVQRNVIGERVLGLPGEPRVDKDVSFRQLAGAA